MRKIFFAVCLLVACSVSSAMAAGSGWDVMDNDEGYLDNALGAVIGLVREGTSDDTDASIPDWPATADSAIENVAGCMTGYIIAFDGTVPPTSVVVSFKDKYGLVLNPDTDDTVNSASVRVKFDTPECIAGGLYADFTVVGNSKKFKVIPLFLR